MYNPIKKLRAYIRLQKAITKANNYFEKTRERQYVLMYGDRLLVTGRSDLKRWKRKKLVPWGVNVGTMERMCIYHTPYGNGTKPMTKLEGEIRRGLYYKAALA